MKYILSLILVLGAICRGFSADNSRNLTAAEIADDSAKAYVRQIVSSLIDREKRVSFRVADQLFAADNGEVISKVELQKIWPDMAARAFKRPVSVDQFFAGVELHMVSPRSEKRLMHDKILKSYTYKDGDIYCDAGHMKDGVESFIGYKKAFIYIIRKIDGQWTLLGIGG